MYQQPFHQTIPQQINIPVYGVNNSIPINHQINCNMDQPIQNLMDRLSSKSSQLYIFWQNYNQLYNILQQKQTQILRLREQITILKKQPIQHMSNNRVQMFDDTFLKQRYLNLQKNHDQLKLQNECKQIHKQNTRYNQQNIQLQTLLQQLREQNTLQRQSIQKILNQLKSAQSQLSTYTKLYQQVQYKQIQINSYIENQKKLNQIILERQQEIEQLTQINKQMKTHYQNLLRQSMQSAKLKVIESLPNLIKSSKQKVQVIAN